MAVKYVPYFKEPIEGQSILDNFTRTKRILKYADNDKVLNRIDKGMPLYEVETEEIVGDKNTENMIIRGECVSACAYLKEHDIKLKNPDVTLFMIIELASSTIFTSITKNLLVYNLSFNSEISSIPFFFFSNSIINSFNFLFSLNNAYAKLTFIKL